MKVPWENLYPSEHLTDPKVVAARRLLAQVIERFEEASKEIDSDPVAADDNVQTCQPILAELFACRSIGDGFATVVNALLVALLNQDGELLTQKQISLITQSLKELSSHLFLTYESALRSLRGFKKAGLRIHPQALQHLDLVHE
jgi:hypothetical protein